MKTIQKIWNKNPSGILISDGYLTNFRDYSKSTFSEIKQKGDKIKEIYASKGITIPKNCDLAKLINNSKELWDKWFLNNISDINMKIFFNSIHLDRIAEPILLLQKEQNINEHLKALVSGSLDFFDHRESHAKNIFWEIEMWADIKRNLDTVYLKEPPDIVIDFDDLKIGIACKKLYSERHVQNVLSEAVRQIEKSFDFGIVALNIDNLAPEGKIIEDTNRQKVAKTLQDFNVNFILRHERHLKKYLSSGRLISSVVSTSKVGITKKQAPKINNFYEKTIWTIPGLDEIKSDMVKKFYNVILA